MRRSISPRVIPGLVLLILLTFGTRERLLAGTTDSLSCGFVSSFDFGPALTGGRIDTTITLINHMQASGLVVVQPADSSFRVFGSGVSIPINGSQGMAFTFQPRSTGTFFDTVFFVDTINHCTSKLVLRGQGIGPTANGATYNLFHPPSRQIGLKGTGDSIRLSISFKNDSTAPITIDTVFFRIGDQFFVDPSFVQHQTIAAGSSVTIVLGFHSLGDLQVYKDSLIVKPNNPIVTEGYAVQGVRISESYVPPIRNHATSVSVFPNPSVGAIRIDAAALHRTSLVITDLLGRTIEAASFSGSWMWDRRSTSGAMVPVGTYYVVVTGWDEGNVQVREVVPIVLE